MITGDKGDKGDRGADDCCSSSPNIIGVYITSSGSCDSIEPIQSTYDKNLYPTLLDYLGERWIPFPPEVWGSCPVIVYLIASNTNGEIAYSDSYSTWGPECEPCV
jgi:hypothetical protein